MYFHILKISPVVYTTQMRRHLYNSLTFQYHRCFTSKHVVLQYSSTLTSIYVISYVAYIVVIQKNIFFWKCMMFFIFNTTKNISLCMKLNNYSIIHLSYDYEFHPSQNSFERNIFQLLQLSQLKSILTFKSKNIIAYIIYFIVFTNIFKRSLIAFNFESWSFLYVWFSIFISLWVVVFLFNLYLK